MLLPTEHAPAHARLPRPIGGYVGRRGGASADTCARPGGASSFSLNAADMVSVSAERSERGCPGARPPLRAGEPRRGVAPRDPGRARGGGGAWNPTLGSAARGRVEAPPGAWATRAQWRAVAEPEAPRRRRRRGGGRLGLFKTQEKVIRRAGQTRSMSLSHGH